MKKIISIVFFVTLVVLFHSCTKRKIPTGEYEFIFEIVNGEIHGTPISLRYEIIESTKEYVIIDNSFRDTLYKNDNEISGTITMYGAIPTSAQNIFYTPFNISGTYEKNNGIYCISGVFTSKIIIPNEVEQRMDTINTSGIFEFKSIF